RLIEVFGGDAGTFSIAQPMRLPGTINFPNAQKRARNRVVAPARLVESNDLAYMDFEFDAAPVEAPGDAAVDIGPPEFVDDLDEFAERYDLPDRTRTIIKAGRLTTKKERDDSRSAWVFDCATSLVRAHVPADKIL